MYKNLKNIYAESSKTNIGFLSLFISSNLCISMIRASTLPHVFSAGRTTTAGQDKTHPTSTGSKHLELLQASEQLVKCFINLLKDMW